MSNLDANFNFDFLDYRNLSEIATNSLTKVIYNYRDFNTVLDHVGNMRYDVELIAGVCGISKRKARRQLLEKEIVSVLNHFDYWEPDEVKEQYRDLYNAYVDCLMSQNQS